MPIIGFCNVLTNPTELHYPVQDYWGFAMSQEVNVTSHDYTVNSVVCKDSSGVSVGQMADTMSRYSTPRGNDFSPLSNGQRSFIIAPIPLGWVRTFITNNGLTVTNVTEAHLMCCGQVQRDSYVNGMGSWAVQTHGTGNNFPLLNIPNQSLGSQIFQELDQKMAAYMANKYPGCAFDDAI